MVTLVSFLDWSAFAVWFFAQLGALISLIWPRNRITMGWCCLDKRRRLCGFFFYLLISFSSLFFADLLSRPNDRSVLICMGLCALPAIFIGRYMYLGSQPEPRHFANGPARADSEAMSGEPVSRGGLLPAQMNTALEPPHPAAVANNGVFSAEATTAPAHKPDNDGSPCAPPEPEPEPVPQPERASSNHPRAQLICERVFLAILCLLFLAVIGGILFWLARHIWDIVGLFTIFVIIAVICGVPWWLWLILIFFL